MLASSLSTPATNIIGFVELVESPHLGTLTTKQREYLEDVKCSAEELLAIVDDLIRIVATREQPTVH